MITTGEIEVAHYRKIVIPLNLRPGVTQQVTGFGALVLLMIHQAIG